MKRFLQELEARLAALPAAQRAELADACRTLIRAIGISTKGLGQHFRPSKIATLGVLTGLVGALGGGGPKFMADLKRLATTTGPHVSAIVQTL